MKSYCFIIILFFTFFNSCKLGSTSNQRQEDYLKMKEDFSESLVSHFPERIDDLVLAYGSSVRNDPEEIKYLTLLKSLTDDESSYFKGKEFSPDSCLFKIHLSRNVYGFNYEAHGKCQEFIPIPAEDLITTHKKLPEDIKYYVIEANKETYYSHEGYQRTYLPKGWENGMTRGIGISEKDNLIFYWVVLW